MENFYHLRRRLQTTVLALLLCMGAVQAAPQEPKLNLDLQNTSIIDVLKAIEAQSEFTFFYNNNLIDPAQKVSVSVKNASLTEVLNRIFAGTAYTYQIVDRQVVIHKPAAKGAGKESFTARGQILDKDSQPLIGATIVDNRTLKGTTTGSDGHFEMQVPSPETELSISFIGYKTVNLPAARIGRVKLEEATMLEDVVVVGYGAVKRVNLTGAVSTIDMKDKTNQPITNTTQAMYNSPGVWVNQNNAKPGADGGTIRIRGVNTLSSASPLVLLDGVEYNINEVNPADIESISVLKDASAAIYGSKASNGVILITTKKGVKGRPVINYRANFGVQYATYVPDPIDDPILYMRLRNQAEINSGKALSGVSYSDAIIKEYQEGMKTDPGVYPSTNWFDICLKPAFMQQHDLRISGGSEKFDYSMAVGYMKQNGVFIANDWANRISMDMKLGVQINKYLKVGASLYGNLRHYMEPGYGTDKVMDGLMRALPIMSDYHENGIYGSSWIATPGRGNYENPRMLIEQGSIDRRVQQLLAKTFVKLTLPHGITYDASFSFRKRDTRSKDHVPAMFTMNPKTQEVRNYNSAVPRVKDWDAWEMGSFFTQTLAWDGNFNDTHHVGVMLGHDYQDFDNNAFQAYKEGFYDNYHNDLNAASGQVNAQATGASSREKLLSVFGRVSYDYKQRYLLSVLFRYDGSSRLAPDHRWAFFPSVSLAWRLDQEEFMKDVTFIDQLKPRFSWGKMGNQAVALYSYLSSVNTSGYDYSFDGTKFGGAGISDMADNTITWEKTTSWNAGLDFSGFANRITFSADWFLKRTEGILRKVNLPSQVGDLNGPKSNVGVVDNKGIELTLGLRDTWGDFSAGVAGNFTYIKNEVVDLNGEEEISGRLISKEGYPINSWYLYDTDGVFQTQAEIDNAKAVYGNKANLRPGYVKYVNQNNDDTIDGKDRIIAGGTIPKYTYGFNVNFGWKGIALEAQFQGVADVSVYPSSNMAFGLYNGAGLTHDWVAQSWSANNRNTKYPLLTTYPEAGENFQNSTLWLQDASYLRLKNIQLSYTFPKQLTQRIRIDRLQIYVSGQNLVTFSDFKIWDPELSLTQVNLFSYPILKTVSFGINITL